MNNAKSLYEDMLSKGIPHNDAREFILTHLGEDPVGLNSATVRLHIEVDINMDCIELDGLSFDDTEGICHIAMYKAETEIGSTYGDIEVRGAYDPEVIEKSLDIGEVV